MRTLRRFLPFTTLTGAAWLALQHRRPILDWGLWSLTALPASVQGEHEDVLAEARIRARLRGDERLVGDDRRGDRGRRPRRPPRRGGQRPPGCRRRARRAPAGHRRDRRAHRTTTAPPPAAASGLRPQTRWTASPSGSKRNCRSWTGRPGTWSRGRASCSPSAQARLGAQVTGELNRCQIETATGSTRTSARSARSWRRPAGRSRRRAADRLRRAGRRAATRGARGRTRRSTPSGTASGRWRTGSSAWPDAR